MTQSLRELARRDRTRPVVKIRERDEPVLAVFDMEGTIISSNVVESYVWARMADLEPDEWPGELVGVFGRIPRYLAIDRRDRGDFLRTFFRRYEGASVAGIERLVDRHVGEFMLQKASAASIRRIREHRAAGHRTLLLTAAATAFLRPLEPLFDLVIGADLQVDDDGRYTGFMSSPPLVGEARAAWLRRYASTEGVDLAHSYAYADSYSDLPLLRAVGNPVAVSPTRISTGSPAGVAADRGVGHVHRHAARPLPEAGEEVGKMALALEFYRSAPKYLGARRSGSAPGLVTGGLAPLRLVTQKDPEPSRDGWARVKPRLSGSAERPLDDLGRSSFYFSPLVSLPFVPGHEVVGELLDDCDDLGPGSASCSRASWVRGSRRGPPCEHCAAGMSAAATA